MQVIVAPHRGPSLAAVGAVFAGLFVTSLVVSTALAGGEHFPSPYEPVSDAAAYFSRHAAAMTAASFLQFAAAIPLGIYTATLVSRLQFLGLRVAGVHIALFGGMAASCLLLISALGQWVLAQGELAGATRALHLFVFATGGPGHVVPLGLLVAGAAVTAGLARQLPRWMMIAGLAIAALAELSALSLVVPAAAILLPLARFSGLIWIVCAGALLPRSPRSAS
jgi:hypothetical protein